MKKVFFVCLTLFCFSFVFATEIRLGVTFDNVGKSRGLGFGLNAHISSSLQENTSLITNLESLGGSKYQADVSIKNTFYSFWNINYGLFFVIQSESIIPAIEFNTGFDFTNYQLELGSKLELNPDDVTSPNTIVATLNNTFNADKTIGKFDLTYRANQNPKIKYNQGIVYLYFGTNEPTSIINIGILADSTINIPKAPNTFNIVANAGLGGTYLRNNKPFDFKLKVQVLDLKNKNSYPFVLSITTNF